MYLKLLFNSFGLGYELTLTLNFLPSTTHRFIIQQGPFGMNELDGIFIRK